MSNATAPICPLAERLFRLDGRADALPATSLLEAHGLDTEDAAQDLTEVRADSIGLCLYAQLYHGGDLLVDSAASYDEIPALVDRLKSSMYDLKQFSTYLTMCPMAAGAVVIVYKTHVIADGLLGSQPAFAMMLVFDVMPRELAKGAMENSFEMYVHASALTEFFEEMPPELLQFLQLRMMRRALTLEPSDGLGPYMFDRLCFQTRNVAVSMQEDGGIEKRRDGDGKSLTRMGSRFPLLEEVVEISIIRLHGALLHAEPAPHVLKREVELGEALEACGDYSHAGLLYSEVASTYRRLASERDGVEAFHETPSWLHHAAAIQFHNAGLAFKRCGSFLQAEAAYVKAMQLVESKAQLATAVKDLRMVYDALVDSATSVARRNEYLRCLMALECLTGGRPANDNNLLLPEYVLLKDARKRLVASLPSLATDPPATRRAILAATNQKTTIFEIGETSEDAGVSEGMQSGAAYSTLVQGSVLDVGFCPGCNKMFDLSQLRHCACGGADATYCSTDCQRAHWPTHKLSCSARRANRKAAAQAAAPVPTEESLEGARAELEAMRLRHDEREAAEAAARQAAERERRATIAAQRANQLDATAPLTSTHPTNRKKSNGKENGAASSTTLAGRAKRAAAKEQSLQAQRSHEAALRGNEEQRLAQAEHLAEMRKLGDIISRGD